jgi:hypothetical protein
MTKGKQICRELASENTTKVSIKQVYKAPKLHLNLLRDYTRNKILFNLYEHAATPPNNGTSTMPHLSSSGASVHHHRYSAGS